MSRFIAFGSLAALLTLGCAQRGSVEIAINVNGESQRSTFAMAAPDFTFIAQCTGMAAVEGVGGRVVLPGGATNCTIRLTSFRWNGTTMTPSTGFTNWSVGDRATFSGGGTSLFARVDAQLPSPLIAGSTPSASYSVFGIAGGDDVTAGEPGDTNASGGVTGDRPPQLRLIAATLDRPNARVTLVFDCTENIVGSNSLATAACAGDPMASMRLGRGADTGSAPTESALISMIAGGSTLSALGASVLPVSAAVPHGGAQVTISLGSVPTSTIVALQAAGSSSFRWARVRFAPGSAVTQIHVVGAYTDINRYGSIPVVIDTGVPTILAVTAYEPMTWNIQLLNGSTLVKVYRAGYYTQSLVGVPSGVPIESTTGYGYSQSVLAGWAQSIQSVNPSATIGSAQGAYESGGFRVRSNLGGAIGTPSETHVVGIYEPGSTSVTVNVNRPGKAVTLVLNAYERTQWQINLIGDTRLTRIVGNGYQGSEFLGATAGAVLSGANNTSSAYTPGSAAMSAFLASIIPSLQVSFINAPTTFTSVQGAYTGYSFNVQ